MTSDQFAELKSLVLDNSRGINRNFEMIGRIYEEHSGRLDRVEKRLTGVEGRLTRVEGRLDNVEGELKDFRVEWREAHTDHERRITALEE